MNLDANYDEPNNNSLQTLFQTAEHNQHRYGVVFSGDGDWQDATIQSFLDASSAQTISRLRFAI